MVYVWKWHTSLWLSFLSPELSHMATLQGRLRIVLNCVVRKKDGTRYIETQVYGKLSKWKKIKTIINSRKNKQLYKERNKIKMITANIYCVLTRYQVLF